MRKCKHPKFGTVQEDGYQYCDNCGMATKPLLSPCHHFWKRIEGVESKTEDGKLSGIIFIVQCDNCGDIEDRKFKI